MVEPIYILAPYPTTETLKDGMIQRVDVIDKLLGNREKIYVNIGLKNPLFSRKKHFDNTIELFFNPLFPIFIITRFLIKSKIVYAHSIHLFKHIPYFLFWINKSNANLILDAHGVVPEEMLMYGLTWKSKYLNWIENKVFRNCNHCICVSQEMINHYKFKYPLFALKYHLFFTSKLMDEPANEDVDKLRFDLGITVKDIVVLYSGNTQIWQNIPMMLETFKTLIQGGIKIIILTGEPDIFVRLFKMHSIPENNIILRAVDPSDLNKYYAIAHYGFILRDDLLINRVSNPTKMLEYLQFGLYPVVLSPYIGDYFNLKYEYIELKDLSIAELKSVKSAKNRDIANLIGKRNLSLNINELIS